MQKFTRKFPEINVGNFFDVIEKTIDEKRHVEYLNRVKENFVWYRDMFKNVFSIDGHPEMVYLFQVDYLLKPNVWRQIEIQGNQTYEQLAKAIIKFMGWRNDHMHGFTIPGFEKPADDSIPFDAITELTFFAPPWDDDPFPTYKSDEIRICQLNHKNHPKLEFIFDYGDGHRFVISFITVRERTKDESEIKFPRLVDQRGVAPKQYDLYS